MGGGLEGPIKVAQDVLLTIVAAAFQGDSAGVLRNVLLTKEAVLCR